MPINSRNTNGLASSTRRSFLSLSTVVCAIAAVFMAAQPAAGFAQGTADTVLVQWDSAALQAVRDTRPGPPIVARALAIAHTCMFDAWAAYSGKAVGTQYGGSLRRPRAERTLANKNEAISYAAYRALLDLFPTEQAAIFDPLMTALGYDPANTTVDATTPAGIGNVTCAAVLAFRHGDGSNQLGDLHPGAYSDWTGYAPVNPPSTVPVDWTTVADPNRWQPLIYDDGATAPVPHIITQKFLAAQWYRVLPFAMTSADQFVALAGEFGPAQYGTDQYRQQAQELIDISARLTDRQKMTAEYWANGPRTETPPGHWALFAQYVSRRDHHTVNQDAKMFFALSNAIFDAGIAAWTPKRVFDSERPVTAIPYLFHGQSIRAWVRFEGTQTIDGSQWLPYQPSTFPTPPFPEYISGHSTFSAAGAEVLRRFTGSDSFGASASFAPGSSTIEPGVTPAAQVTLHWNTFTEAADEAGISRRYGGIHFKTGDLVGRLTGGLVGAQAWSKAATYIDPDGRGGNEDDER